MMKTRSNYTKLHGAHSESGIAVLEFIITFPILFFTVIAIVDMSRWIETYSETSRVAYEGARYAASLEGLAEAVAIVTPYGSDTIPDDKYDRLVTRIQRIMTEQGMDVAGTALRIEKFDPAVKNAVELRISVPFEAYSKKFLGTYLLETLAGWDSADITVETPYLFTEN